MTSDKTRITSSVRPPTKPAVKPRTMPVVIPISEAKRPTNKEFGAPIMISASRSRPPPSVPSGKSRTPVCFRRFSKPKGGNLTGAEPVNTRSKFHKMRPIIPSAMMPSSSAAPQISFGLIQGLSNRFIRRARRRSSRVMVASAIDHHPSCRMRGSMKG